MAEFLRQQDGIIDFDILINGSKIRDSVEVQEISTEMEVNRIASATIVIQDGGAIGVVNDPFIQSEGKDFIPGSEIEIALGYIGKTKKVFKGIIISQRLLVKGDKSQLIIKCQDNAVNLTKGRFNAIFQNMKDSDAIRSIVSKYNVELDMDNTTYEHPCLMQYNCSDWDYLVLRAEANNMVVTTNQNKLGIKYLDTTEEPNYEIKSSQFVIDIDLSLESKTISGSYGMSSWDPETQEIVSNSVQVQDSLGQGNLSAEKLAYTLKNNFDSYSSAPISKTEMEVHLKSLANNAVLNKVRGKITVPGNTKIIAGDIIKLSEFSSRFNGKTYISKVVHSLHDGEWLTILHVGKDMQSHASLLEVEEVGASGLFPAVRGVQIGTVKKIFEDPDNKYRALVTMPAFTGAGQEDGIWARIAFPYASADAGYFFFPEVGDEVLLTFMNNDPRFPIITGSLYSQKNRPKEEPNDKNQFKSIYSKSGIHITFDDEDKILTVQTPEMNTIILDDKNKSIRIKDMNENSLIMDDSGITLNTPKDLNLKADGNINISATSNLALSATADATLDGASITQNAKTSFTARGNASAELSASGQTTIKGAMVMIN